MSVRKINQRKPIWFSFRAGLSEGLEQERRRGMEEREGEREISMGREWNERASLSAHL